MMKDDSVNTSWEGGQQWQIHQEQLPPPQRKVSRRVLLIGGLGGLAAGSLLATIVGVKLLQRPQSHPFLTIPSGGGKLVWSPNGKRIAICDANGVRVLDGQSGHQLWDYKLALSKRAYANLLTLTWLPDGNHLYYVNNQTLHALDAESGKRLWMDTLISNDYNASGIRLAWSPDGSRCAIGPTTTTSVEGQVVFIWNIAARKLIAICSFPVTSGSPEVLNELAWSPDGSQLASIDTNGNMQVWPASGGPPAWSWSYVDHGSSTTVSPWISWSLRGDTLASGYFLGEYALWQASSGKQLFQKKPDVGQYFQDGGPAGASRSPDGTRLMLFAFQDHTHLLVLVWNIQSNQLLFTCQGSPQGDLLNAAWSPNGKDLAACYSAGQHGEDSGVQLWDASNGNALAFYNAPLFPAGLAWSPDSRSLAVYTPTGEQCNNAVFRSTCLLTNYAYQIFRI